MKVAGQRTVHGELHSKARGVDEEQHPSARVGCRPQKRLPRLHRLDVGLAAQVLVRSVRAVVRKQVKTHRHDDIRRGRNHHHHAPRLVVIQSEHLHEVEELRHQRQSDTAAGIAPAGRHRVGRADDVAREHGRRPKFGDHERRTYHADEETTRHERAVVESGAQQVYWKGKHRQQRRLRYARSVTIRHRADHEAHQHRPDERNGVGVVHLGLGVQAQRRTLFDRGQQRWHRKPPEKR
eukprot:ctg_1139.g389